MSKKSLAGMGIKDKKAQHQMNSFTKILVKFPNESQVKTSVPQWLGKSKLYLLANKIRFLRHEGSKLIKQ